MMMEVVVAEKSKHTKNFKQKTFETHIIMGGMKIIKQEPLGS